MSAGLLAMIEAPGVAFARREKRVAWEKKQFDKRDFVAASHIVNKMAFGHLALKWEARRKHDLASANHWLRSHKTLERDDLYLACTDAELVYWCEKRVKECQKWLPEAMLEHGWNTDHLPGALARCLAVFDRYGMQPRIINVKSPKEGPSLDLLPVARRFVSEKWWRRQARVLQAREVEQVMRDRQAVAKYRQVYCSDWLVRNRDKAAKRNAETLEKFKAVNEEGQEYTLAELAALGTGDLSNRRNELMVRMRGFEEVAVKRGHVAEFWTITAPAAFHRMRWLSNAGKAVSVERWNHSTARRVHEFLCKRWELMRAEFARQEIRCYGFRVVEPHHDGTPHWHLFLMFHQADVHRARTIAKDYLLEEGPHQPGVISARFTAQSGDPAKGGAAAYMAKYIAKNIDGAGVRGALKMQDDESGLDIGSAALRVRSWASGWGIRQFQQIGGPSVTVWRELRRLWSDAPPGKSDLNPIYEPDLFGDVDVSVLDDCGNAADAGDWAAFVEAMGGADLPRADRPLKPAYWLEEDIDKSSGEVVCNTETEYGDKATGRVFGLMVRGISCLLTRLHRWTISRIEEVKKKDAQPREWGSGFCDPPGRLGLV